MPGRAKEPGAARCADSASLCAPSRTVRVGLRGGLLTLPPSEAALRQFVPLWDRGYYMFSSLALGGLGSTCSRRREGRPAACAGVVVLCWPHPACAGDGPAVVTRALATAARFRARREGPKSAPGRNSPLHPPAQLCAVQRPSGRLRVCATHARSSGRVVVRASPARYPRYLCIPCATHALSTLLAHNLRCLRAIYARSALSTRYLRYLRPICAVSALSTRRPRVLSARYRRCLRGIWGMHVPRSLPVADPSHPGP